MSSKPKLKEKRLFYTEHAYFFGILLIALSSALMVNAGFGVSMVDAPAYIFYLKGLSSAANFTFGTAVYTYSGFVLLFLILVTGKVNRQYGFCLLSTIIYSFFVDSLTKMFMLIPLHTLWYRILLLVFACVIAPLGLVLLRHTYVTSVAHDFFVVNFAKKINKENVVVKTIYWLSSALLATVLSFYFFGKWVFIGVGIGSVVHAITYIFLFKFYNNSIEKNFRFRDKYKQIKRHFT